MTADTTASANRTVHLSSQIPSTTGSHTPALQAVTVTPLVSIIQDISKCQCQLSRNEQNLECTKERLKKFEELVESLRGSMVLSTVVTPVLENMRKERRCLEAKIDQDIRRLTEAWDEVLNLFIRVIYQQFDKEMEDNKESLHREARALFNTLSEKYLAVPTRVFSSESNYSLEYPPDAVSRKRPRVDSDDVKDTSHFPELVSRMQGQLDRQSEKIDFLLRQNKLIQTLHGERMPSSLR